MKYLYLILSLSLVSCSSEPPKKTASNNSIENIWNVPTSDIQGGISTFPVMINPVYSNISEVNDLNYLAENAKVAMLNINGNIYAYPYDFTNYYEVINDSFENTHFALTYCPNTKSALCFNRELSTNEIITLRASGYLYKDNQITSDSNHNQYWPQMKSSSIRGYEYDETLETFNIVETTWSILKNHFPNAAVFKHENTNSCNNCTQPSIPLHYNRFGVINESNNGNDLVHLYDYDNFSNNTQIEYLTVNGKNAIVVGNKGKVFFNSFYTPIGLSFSPLPSEDFPNILIDNENNKWNVFGVATFGDRMGNQLNSPKSFIASISAWESHFENIEIHD